MNYFIPTNINQNTFKTSININDFSILGQLGINKSGSIYKVQYNLTGDIYIIKSINLKNFQHKDSELDFLREKEILYDLTKKNISYFIKLFADCHDDNYQYLVKEYYEGTTLKQLRGNPQNFGYIDQKLIIHILKQLLEALQYLHDTCHIVHRDINPENIILGRDNNIKIIDFSIAAYLVHNNKILISNRSFKGNMKYIPPEILFSLSHRIYDYKIDIFSLGYTIYSLMNPSKDGKVNLPTETKIENGVFQRMDKPLVNKYYDSWLIEFVQRLFENDQNKRPTAANALNSLNSILFNLNSKLNTMHNKFTQFNKNINVNNNNNIKNQNEIIKPNISSDDTLISSVKSLLIILNKLDFMDIIKEKFYKLFNNININYKQFFIYSFFEILELNKQWENGQINQINYNQAINNFIKLINNNNKTAITCPGPIILYYIIDNIFNQELQKYFKNFFHNNIFNEVIQNNFENYNIIVPTKIKIIYDSLKNNIYDFKNNYIGPFVDNCYILILLLLKCHSCGYIFGIKNYEVAGFLQLDVNYPINNLQVLIDNYFIPKTEEEKVNCQKCGNKGKKLIQKYCLNLPNYLILELDDKNIINFDDRINIPLYNGKIYYYQYLATIYKSEINNISNFVTIINNGNNYIFYSNDKIVVLPNKNTNLDSPSLAIYKKI